MSFDLETLEHRLTDPEIKVLNHIKNGELFEARKPNSPVLIGLHRMGYIKIMNEYCGPLMMNTGKCVRITEKGLRYISENT